jgi:hypothetical protein
MTPRARRIALAVCVVLLAAACSRYSHAVGPDAGKYVASMRGERYHRLDCAKARKIGRRQLLYYRTGDDAYKDGFTPCQVCHPERKDEARPGT